MTETPVAPGSIRLHDKVTPTLTAGIYRFRSKLDVTGTGTAGGSPPEHLTHVQVSAPRLALDASEVTGHHPPRDAVGAFGDRLPHVVLGRRTLPWERRFTDGTPWLALLVVRADEASLVTGPLRTTIGETAFTRLNGIEPVDANRAVVGLRAKDLATFRALLPSRDDVRLLTHVRQVNVADTALAGSDDDGWFAVVTANRLPLGGTTPTKYTACLVSLEGREDAWASNLTSPPTLIVLASWPFVTSSAGGTFEHVAAHLDLGAFGAPPAGQPPLVDADGALALAGTRRDGSPTTVGYRSPLLGAAPDPLPAGPDDVTGDAAFELGRLLAAADGRFIREVVAWHRAADDAARTDSAATLRADSAQAYAAAGPAPRRAAAAASADEADRLAVAGADLRAAATSADPLAGLGATFAQRLLSRTTRADLWQAHPGGDSVIPRQLRPEGEDS
ncbi:hypothetical protein GA0070609_3010 [Micromonospora echinaurantiaca]|uniref:Uncharacterized protein n=1 Tax=Micromonospora echinaurantiaca TaxID=47857 RepID=A0A1C5IBI6_9ACTN|nr:hypothetical protein [Micromonospora echinaurantiaca]SCG55126.1 hypothetical protein GA0070609_3010 [Micromonospora echinaurantiaca]